MWRGDAAAHQVSFGDLMSPGGSHSFEHRWAVDEAIKLHLQIGKVRVEERIHGLNSMAKEALATMPHVKLHTPRSPALSAGIIAFEVAGMQPRDVVKRLGERGIIASASPYRVSYPRIAPSLINNEDEVRKTVEAIRSLA